MSALLYLLGAVWSVTLLYDHAPPRSKPRPYLIAAGIFWPLLALLFAVLWPIAWAIDGARYLRNRWRGRGTTEGEAPDA